MAQQRRHQSSSNSRNQRASDVSEAETWRDFLRSTADASSRMQTERAYGPQAPSIPPPSYEANASSSTTRKRLLSTSEEDASSSQRSNPRQLREIIDLTNHSDSPERSPEIIDLTTSPGSAERSRIRSHPTPSSRDIVLPRWIPDEEAEDCAVCHLLFTFLLRRHHCRKCGKVVCIHCSPHRITMPRRYIVRPPAATRARSMSVGFLTGESNTDAQSMSGSETVRVCNPCVPDPNNGPPPQPRALLTPRNVLPPSALPPLYSNDILNNLLNHHPNAGRSRHQPNPRRSPRRAFREDTDAGERPTVQPYCGWCGRDSSRAGANNRPCEQCARVETSSSLIAYVDPPPPNSFPARFGTHRYADPRDVASSTSASDRGHVGSSRVSSRTSNEPTAHVVYKATARDCVEGVHGECPICLGEYEVGEKLARMWCLCTMHEKCATQWWEHRRNDRHDEYVIPEGGRCPTHGVLKAF